MFDPPPFRLDDRAKIFAFIAAHPLGLLITMEDGAPSADLEWILAQASALTETQEAGRPAPWAVKDAPEDYIEAQARSIVGVEIRIDSIAGKFKLSQNRDAADRAGASAGLAQQQDAAAKAVAARMMEREHPGKKLG